ncbi:unnamed protein product [Amoebophrya sp. A120]|nr:unnamed protein product [Amoebophrya sp. A120]|eukprot:GSA120T00016239001.1
MPPSSITPKEHEPRHTPCGSSLLHGNYTTGTAPAPPTQQPTRLGTSLALATPVAAMSTILTTIKQVKHALEQENANPEGASDAKLLAHLSAIMFHAKAIVLAGVAPELHSVFNAALSLLNVTPEKMHCHLDGSGETFAETCFLVASTVKNYFLYEPFAEKNWRNVTAMWIFSSSADETERKHFVLDTRRFPGCWRPEMSSNFTVYSVPVFLEDLADNFDCWRRAAMDGEIVMEKDHIPPSSPDRKRNKNRKATRFPPPKSSPGGRKASPPTVPTSNRSQGGRVVGNKGTTVLGTQGQGVGEVSEGTEVESAVDVDQVLCESSRKELGEVSSTSGVPKNPREKKDNNQAALPVGGKTSTSPVNLVDYGNSDASVQSRRQPASVKQQALQTDGEGNDNEREVDQHFTPPTTSTETEAEPVLDEKITNQHASAGTVLVRENNGPTAHDVEETNDTTSGTASTSSVKKEPLMLRWKEAHRRFNAEYWKPNLASDRQNSSSSGLRNPSRAKRQKLNSAAGGGAAGAAPAATRSASAQQQHFRRYEEVENRPFLFDPSAEQQTASGTTMNSSSASSFASKNNFSFSAVQLLEQQQQLHQNQNQNHLHLDTASYGSVSGGEESQSKQSEQLDDVMRQLWALREQSAEIEELRSNKPGLFGEEFFPAGGSVLNSKQSSGAAGRLPGGVATSSAGVVGGVHLTGQEIDADCIVGLDYLPPPPRKNKNAASVGAKVGQFHSVRTTNLQQDNTSPSGSSTAVQPGPVDQDALFREGAHKATKLAIMKKPTSQHSPSSPAAASSAAIKKNTSRASSPSDVTTGAAFALKVESKPERPEKPLQADQIVVKGEVVLEMMSSAASQKVNIVPPPAVSRSKSPTGSSSPTGSRTRLGAGAATRSAAAGVCATETSSKTLSPRQEPSSSGQQQQQLFSQQNKVPQASVQQLPWSPAGGTNTTSHNAVIARKNDQMSLLSPKFQKLREETGTVQGKLQVKEEVLAAFSTTTAGAPLQGQHQSEAGEVDSEIEANAIISVRRLARMEGARAVSSTVRGGGRNHMAQSVKDPPQQHDFSSAAPRSPELLQLESSDSNIKGTAAKHLTTVRDPVVVTEDGDVVVSSRLYPKYLQPNGQVSVLPEHVAAGGGGAHYHGFSFHPVPLNAGARSRSNSPHNSTSPRQQGRALSPREMKLANKASYGYSRAASSHGEGDKHSPRSADSKKNTSFQQRPHSLNHSFSSSASASSSPGKRTSRRNSLRTTSTRLQQQQSSINSQVAAVMDQSHSHVSMTEWIQMKRDLLQLIKSIDITSSQYGGFDVYKVYKESKERFSSPRSRSRYLTMALKHQKRTGSGSGSNSAASSATASPVKRGAMGVQGTSAGTSKSKTEAQTATLNAEQPGASTSTANPTNQLFYPDHADSCKVDEGRTTMSNTDAFAAAEASAAPETASTTGDTSKVAAEVGSATAAPTSFPQKPTQFLQLGNLRSISLSSSKSPTTNSVELLGNKMKSPTTTLLWHAGISTAGSNIIPKVGIPGGNKAFSTTGAGSKNSVDSSGVEQQTLSQRTPPVETPLESKEGAVEVVEIVEEKSSSKHSSEIEETPDEEETPDAGRGPQVDQSCDGNPAPRKKDAELTVLEVQENEKDEKPSKTAIGRWFWGY